MEIKELERVVFTKPSLVTEELQEVAREAETFLGYTKLAAATAAPTSLGHVIKKLDIAPLIPSSVEKYKSSKEKAGMWSGHKQGLLCLAIIPVIFAIIRSITASLPSASNLNFFQGSLIGLCVAMVIASVILFARSMFCFFDSDMRGDRSSIAWGFTHLESYPGSIPEYVLAKAIAIKKELPTVSFAIDQLYEKYEHTPTRSRQPDPFLVAYVGSEYNYDLADRIRHASESYYIDVWDEKEYERTM